MIPIPLFHDLNLRVTDLSWNQRNAFCYALTNYIYGALSGLGFQVNHNKEFLITPGFYPFRYPTNMGDCFIAPSLGQLMRQIWENDGTPPASMIAVKKLADVKNNKKLLASMCVVCSEKFALSDEAKSMPCGHIYHKKCILLWLDLHNTCPICRDELPTDDISYEKRKKETMITTSAAEASGSGSVRDNDGGNGWDMGAGSGTESGDNEEGNGREIGAGSGTKSIDNEEGNGSGTESGDNEEGSGIGTESGNDEEGNGREIGAGSGTESRDNEEGNGSGTESGDNEEGSGIGTESGDNEEGISGTESREA